MSRAGEWLEAGEPFVSAESLAQAEPRGGSFTSSATKRGGAPCLQFKPLFAAPPPCPGARPSGGFSCNV